MTVRDFISCQPVSEDIPEDLHDYLNPDDEENYE